ncbi:MAG TPA: TetR family transcriptional regulator [Thermoleophilaceae bacterium]|nr:TetR family transcriptional regulator [Thermoleophilaceae bacterium]
MPTAVKQSRRERQAAETRQEILDAAARLFAGRGFATTSIKDIAAEAGVAVQTIYSSVGSKGMLLRTVADTMDAKAGVREQWERIRGTDDPRQMVRFGVQIVRAFVDDERAGRLQEAIQAAAPTEPEIAEVLAEGMRRHRAGTRGLVEHIAQGGHLRAGLAPERGGSIFASVTHPAVWRSLWAEHGWTLDEIEDWMTGTLAAQLLADG